MYKFGAFCSAVLALLSTTGCGPSYLDTNKVEGVITYKGEPVDGARIMFIPIDESGVPSYGQSDSTGKYVIQAQQGKVGGGAVPGQYKVTITKSIDVPTGKMRKTPEGGEEPIVEGKELLPVKYKFAQRSPLNATVEDIPVNVIDFKLE